MHFIIVYSYEVFYFILLGFASGSSFFQTVLFIMDKYTESIQKIYSYLHCISRTFWEWQIEEGGIIFLGGEYEQNLYGMSNCNFHEMMQQGVLIYKENHLCMPAELNNLMRERENYMADYVINDTGRLCEIHLDKLPG